MSKSHLALLGGEPVITTPFAPYRTMGEEEARAAHHVVSSGVLSAFFGSPGPGFLGGEEIRALESEAGAFFGGNPVVARTSWTGGLGAGVGALGLEPGDEVIVPPWTMSATATAILHWNAIPVFGDIEQKTFILDPDKVSTLISNRTRAIAVVDIFGHPADMDAFGRLAKEHGLKLISDTAQAPGTERAGRKAGTQADIGGYSLNYHKHIHCGEGGLAVTNDDALADRMRLIRNHAEVVVQPATNADLVNMLGFNFRLGEIEAAIARIQLGKLEARLEDRQAVAQRLRDGLSGLEGLRLPVVEEGATHAFYVFGMVLDPDALKVGRRTLVEALQAEGVPGLMAGYQNIHRLPLFEKKIAFGSGGFPWNLDATRKDIRYGQGTCPVAERLHDETFLGVEMCAHEFSEGETDQVIEAFKKVWAQLDVLAGRDKAS
jgi:dTDP-4-amino-4,6-dideoxygalactose transaminase